MDVREKLVNVVKRASYLCLPSNTQDFHINMLVTDLIAHGVTVHEWIPASEPPKDTCEYWIAYKAGGDYSYSTGYFDGKCWCSALTHHKIPVPHWMPLPHPPKGE